MTYPIEKLKVYQHAYFLKMYWREYVPRLVDYHVNSGPKPQTFDEWWIAKEGIKFDIFSFMDF